MKKNSSLTPGESKKLTEFESVIDRGVKSFFEVGNALFSIKALGLYADVDKTFEGYCKKRWNFGRAYAYRLIGSAKVIENLSPIGDIAPPSNEAQARVLAEIEDENQQADVWVKAVETAPKNKDGEPQVTAAHIKSVAKEMFGEPEPEDEPEPPTPEPEPAATDELGRDVPEKLAGVFEHRAEFKAVLSSLSKIKGELADLGAISPFLHVQSAQIEVKNVFEAVKLSAPYTACPYCVRGCDACKKTGWVPKPIYDAAPKEKK